MNFKDASALLDGVVEANRIGEHLVLFLHGSVGSAKSALMKAASERHNMPLHDVRLSIHDTVDFSGVPEVRDGRTYFNPAGWLPNEGPCFLFLDEYPQASVAMQNVAGGLIYDRAVGGYTLPEDCIVVVAGNRQEDRAGTTRTPQQINNRCIHVHIEADYDVWRLWAADNGIDPRIISFLDNRTALLHEPSRDEEAFPTLRTWEMASKVLRLDLPANVRNETLMGTIGKGPAAEFIGFLATFEGMPSWRVVLSKPQAASLPAGPAVTYALVETLARRVTWETMANLTIYLGRLPTTEIGNLCVNRVATLQPALSSHPAYTTWVLDHRI
jgi:hypothetical protein